MPISSKIFDEMEQPEEEMDLSAHDDETLQREWERRQAANKAKDTFGMPSSDARPQTIASGGLLVPPITKPVKKPVRPPLRQPIPQAVPTGMPTQEVTGVAGIEMTDPEDEELAKRKAKKMFA